MSDTSSVFTLGVVVSLVDNATRYLNDMQGHWKRITGDLKGVDSAVKQVEASIHKSIQGATMLAGSLKLGGVMFGPSVKDAIDFEKSLAVLQGTSKATSKEMKELEKAAIKAGLATEWSPKDAVAGLTSLSSIGMNTAQSMKALIPAMEMATASAGKLKIDDTARLLGMTMNAFGQSADKASSVGDVLVRTAQLAAFGMEDLESAFRAVNGVVGSSNQNLTTVSAVMTGIRNQGKSVAETGEAVKMFLNQLRDIPVDKKAQAVLKDLGVSATYTSGTMKGKLRDVIDIMADLDKAMTGKGWIQEKRGAAIFDLVGRDAASAFDMVMNSSIEVDGRLLKGVDAIRYFKGEYQKAGGSLKEYADIQKNTTAGSIQLLKGNFETISILIGQTFLPTIARTTNAFVGLLGPVVAFLDKHKSFKETIVWATSGLVATIALVGAIKLFAGAIGLVSGLSKIATAMTVAYGYSVNALSLGYALLTKSEITNASVGKMNIGQRVVLNAVTWANTMATGVNATAQHLGSAAMLAGSAAAGASGIAKVALTAKTGALTVAQWALNAAFLANPITWVVIGIVALGAAVYGIYKYWDDLVGVVKKAWRAIQDFFGIKPSEEDTLSAQIDKYDSKLKSLEEKKLKYQKMGFSADSEDMKSLDSQIKITKGQKDSTASVLSGTQNYNDRIKEIDAQKKLAESELKNAKRGGDSSAVSSLESQLKKLETEKNNVSKNQFIKDAQIDNIHKGIEEIKHTDQAVKNLGQSINEVDFTKLNPQAMVSKSNEAMKKMQEQACCFGNSGNRKIRTGKQGSYE